VRVLYFDCFSGASGDMLLGAMLDAGATESEVRQSLDALSITGWNLTVSSATRGGLRATRAEVGIEKSGARRDLPDIVALLEGAELPERVRDRSLRTFTLLADAEARVHGVERDQVHFHEVGSTDAIIDVVGCCAALHSLNVEMVVASGIATGMSTLASSEHGSIPVPAPAVLELLQGTGAMLFEGGREELITPTGAALLVAMCDRFGELPGMHIDATGYGAGARELAHPNIVRALVGELTNDKNDDVMLIETNLDDMNPEMLPHVIEKLLAAEALDAWTTGAVMKKGRPGHILSVLGTSATKDALIELIFQETSTLGVRTSPARRSTLERSWVDVQVSGHPVRVKLGSRAGKVITVAPEYEDARAAAEGSGLALREIYERARREASRTRA